MASKDKVTVSLDSSLLGWLDELVQNEAYESRSAAVEAAVEALHRDRMNAQLEAALASLTSEDLEEQKALAEDGVGEWLAVLDAEDGGWPAAEAKHAAG